MSKLFCTFSLSVSYELLIPLYSIFNYRETLDNSTGFGESVRKK